MRSQLTLVKQPTRSPQRLSSKRPVGCLLEACYVREGQLAFEEDIETKLTVLEVIDYRHEGSARHTLRVGAIESLIDTPEEGDIRVRRKPQPHLEIGGVR
jgi:hypothetical protein